MKRSIKWESLLAQCIADARNKAFAWGEFDCCLFVADALRAMTGVDIAEPLRGKYDSAESAAGAIREYAGAGLDELCEKRAVELSLSEVPIKLAQRGDIVLVELPVKQADGINQSIGIVGLDGRYVLCASERGIVRLKQQYWVKAWATR